MKLHLKNFTVVCDGGAQQFFISDGIVDCGADARLVLDESVLLCVPDEQQAENGAAEVNNASSTKETTPS